MESKIFSIGDIVALKAHPFIAENTNVIISGDHLPLPPLMVVTEIVKSSYKAGDKRHNTFKYRCIWFAQKSFKFEDADVYEDQLKLIQKATGAIDITNVERGSKLNFKTVLFELGKKKSTLGYDENLFSRGTQKTTINALLTFVPPVLQFMGTEPYKPKHPSDKAATDPPVPVTAAKIIYFDPTNNSISEFSLPLESLELVEEVSEKRLSGIQKIIEKSGYVLIGNLRRKTIIKPKNIASRSGYYYLNGFDYLTNKLEEFELKSTTKIKSIPTPFGDEAPKFDILKEPESATQKFISQEIITLINKAVADNSYITIKYINRNDQITQRTVRNMQLVTVKEDGLDATYLVGFCLLRLEKRTFRIERIQSLQLLILKYKTV